MLVPITNSIDKATTHPCVKPLPIQINTSVKFPFEELDTHDGKHKPEEKTDEKYIENGWNRVHQRIHHNLYVERQVELLHSHTFSKKIEIA